MIERKDPLLSTLVNVEDGGEGVDTAIRKLDREFDNVIKGANSIGYKVGELDTDVTALKNIDTSIFAKKEELIDVVAGGGISIVQTGKERKISSSIGNATTTESGLMSFIDKNLVISWDENRDKLISHENDPDKHIPEGGTPGQVLTKKSLEPYDVKWVNVGGVTPTVYKVANQTPDEIGNVDLKPTHIGAVTQTEYNTAMKDKADKIHTHPEYNTAMKDKADKIHTHPEANDSEAGFMSAEDKTKLDTYAGIESGNAGKSLIVNATGTGTEWTVVSGVPVGTIIAWGGLTAPTGYLECAGQIVKRAIYKDLFQAIGTVWGTTGADNFKLPDFKTAARFLRSRGNGLEVGTVQEDAIRNITGRISDIPHGALSAVGFSGAFTNAGDSSYGNGTGGGSCHSTIFDASKAPGVLVADENRPKNAVVMYCIKAVDEYVNPAQVDMAKVDQEKANRDDVKELAGTRLWRSDLHGGFNLQLLNNSSYIVDHKLTIDPNLCDFGIALLCVAPEFGYTAGTILKNFNYGYTTAAVAASVSLTNKDLFARTLSNFQILPRTAGNPVNPTYANWRVIFWIKY